MQHVMPLRHGSCREMFTVTCFHFQAFLAEKYRHERSEVHGTVLDCDLGFQAYLRSEGLLLVLHSRTVVNHILDQQFR